MYVLGPVCGSRFRHGGKRRGIRSDAGGREARGRPTLPAQGGGCGANVGLLRRAAAATVQAPHARPCNAPPRGLRTHLFRGLGGELVPALAVLVEKVNHSLDGYHGKAEVVRREAQRRHAAQAVRRRHERLQMAQLHGCWARAARPFRVRGCHWAGWAGRDAGTGLSHPSPELTRFFSVGRRPLPAIARARGTSPGPTRSARAMAAKGASLQNYNNELVKCEAPAARSRAAQRAARMTPVAQA